MATNARVIDLIGRAPRLTVDVAVSLPAEMLTGLLKWGMQDSVETFDVGQAWFDEVRKKLSPELTAALDRGRRAGLYPGGNFVGLALLPPACEDIPSFIQRLREMEGPEVWLTLAGYHAIPLREKIGADVYRRAAGGDAEARGAVLDGIRALDDKSTGGMKPSPTMDLDPAATKALVLEILERWYEDIFRETEVATRAILVRDAEVKQAMAKRLSPEELIQAATNGLQFRQEPWATRVVLIPHVVLRPWNQLDAWEEMDIIGYPVADESLGIDSSAPPARLLRLHKALADEKRLRMLKILAGGSATLQQLAQATGLAKSSAHHHLVILRSAGLVLVTTSEESVYTLRRDFIPEASAMLGTFLEGGAS
jgi:DNA-binding transcriptional ArsR family regulator